MSKLLIMEPKDNVAVSTSVVNKGSSLNYMEGSAQKELTASTDVPIYHKIALREIPQGCLVYKYGHIIGEATENIPAGAHVHIHNLKSSDKKN